MTAITRRITPTGWWWLAVGTVSALLATLALSTLVTPWRLALALTGIGMLVVGFALVGARRVDHPAGSPALVVVAALATGVATAGTPTMAIMQVIAYPIAWTFVPSVRAAVLGNLGVAAAVAAGFLVSLGTTADDLAQLAFTVVLSLGFSLAMGFWIARMSELGERNGVLLAELRGAQDQIAALNRDAGAAAERERLARELHDTIAQDLTGLVMLAQRARREAGRRDETLALIEESARTALGETRALVAAGAAVTGAGTGTSPDGGHAPDLDLPQALERLAARFQRETGVHVAVLATDAPALDRDREVVVLRCAQEAVANARKHARASRITIALTHGDGCAQLVVEDDGAGFDPATASDGFGLAGMTERLALVGGSLTIDSEPGRGTVLTAAVPLTATAVDAHGVDARGEGDA